MTLSPPAGRVRLAGLDLDALTEDAVVGRILEALAVGEGGWVATPNIDICRLARRDKSLARLVSGASLTVPDGMPLLWAARLGGQSLPERVTGAALIFSLSEAAARQNRSVYLLGGAAGIPEAAGLALADRYPGLAVAGAYSPPVGFESAPGGLETVLEKLAAAAPDIVYVGLGFPKQERLISYLAPALPGSWFIACGAAIPFAAGMLPRAPGWMQRAGLEWLHRLATEPRRLFRRYVVHDLPFAATLIAVSVAARLAGSAGHRRPGDAGGP